MRTEVTATTRSTLRKVGRGPWGLAAEWACRAGYAARGFVYISIGVIALLAALDRTPRAQGALGALEAWADWPFGIALLWLTAVGLACFAGWRLLQSVFDADRQGREPKAIAARVGQAISGVVYGGLALSVVELLDALEDLKEVDDQAETRENLTRALAMPAGEWIVMLVGLFILGCGVGNLVKAFKGDFAKQLRIRPQLADKASLLGRVGYGARGVVFLVPGAFIALAGLHARGGEAKSTGGALEWLEAQPFGSALLGLTALGLIAFGAYAFVEARYRSLRVKEMFQS